MRKNKIGDILFGLLLLGFTISVLNGCGQAEQPPSAAWRETAVIRETDGLPVSQETEESPTTQEQEVFSGPEDRDCTSYVIPNGVKEIGEGAFYGCSSLTSIEIPDSVTVIGEYAFEGCSSLTDIEIPDSVTVIDHYAFCDCSSLTHIEIPDGVTWIGEGAFEGCSSLTSIEIPDSVTEIYSYAFVGCSSLASIEIPDSVTEIYVEAFINCSSLIDIKIPDGVTYIGMSTFAGCSSLTSIEIPDSVTEIGHNAFYCCISLTSMTLPKNLDIDLSDVFGTGYSYIQFVYDSEIEANEEAETAALAPYDMSSLEAISSVCGLVAPVEEDVLACHWDSYGEHPYDVVYDYGEEYQKYVDACDWSLVFDADYYMAEFPMLALQFHYDKDELLFHFQTVGIHEGRQGCENFNVGAYLMNSDDTVYEAFAYNYEGYYLYYMLNYETEKDVNTTTYSDMSKIRTMYKFHPTALQLAEVTAVNADRNDVNVDAVTMRSEQCAFANYRAYLNAHDGWNAHSWAIENNDLFQKYCSTMGASYMAENTVTMGGSHRNGQICEPNYYNSKSHYEAMVDARYDYIGVSNVCNGNGSSSQFDFFIDID